MSLCQKCANVNCNHEIEPGEVVVRCGAFKPPMTNADKIRAMSDEEIAEWVCENGPLMTMCDIICGGDCNAVASLKNSGDEACKEIVKKWLRQPAEEDDHADM